MLYKRESLWFLSLLILPLIMSTNNESFSYQAGIINRGFHTSAHLILTLILVRSTISSSFYRRETSFWYGCPRVSLPAIHICLPHSTLTTYEVVAFSTLMKIKKKIHTLTWTHTSTTCGFHNNLNIFYENLRWFLLLISFLKLSQGTFRLNHLHMHMSQPSLWDTLHLLPLFLLTVIWYFIIHSSTLIRSSQWAIHLKLIFLHNARITAYPTQTDISLYLKRSKTSKALLSFKRTLQLAN